MTSKASTDADEATEAPAPTFEAVAEPPRPGRVSRPTNWPALLCWLAVAVLGSLLISARVDLGLPAHGWSITPQPQHPYSPLFLLWPLFVAAVFGGMLLALRDSDREARRRPWLALTMLLALHFGLSVTLDMGQTRPSWAGNAAASTWSEVSNGYFGAASEIRYVRQFLRDYPRIQANAGYKLSTHPPGAVLAYWVPLRLYARLPWLREYLTGFTDWLINGHVGELRRFLMSVPTAESHDQSQMPSAIWCVLWIAFLGSTAVVPTYLLGTAFGGRRAGLTAATLLCFMPNSLFYYLSLDVVILTFTAWALWFLVGGLQGRRWPGLWGLLSGGMLFAALFTSIGALASLVLAGGLALVMALRRECTRRALLLTAMGAAGGLLLGWAVVALAGADMPRIVHQGLAAHRGGAGGTGHRPYYPWVAWNLVDYALFCGIPLVVAALAGLKPSALVTPAVAAVAVLLALTLSGIVKGETERLWIFFNPLLAVAAAVVAEEREGWYATLASLPLQLLLMALCLPPLVRPW